MGDARTSSGRRLLLLLLREALLLQSDALLQVLVDALTLYPEVIFPVAVGAEPRDESGIVRSTVRNPVDVMGFKVWPATSALKRCPLLAAFADSVRPLQHVLAHLGCTRIV